MKKYINAKLKGKKELHEILIKDGKFENISAKPSYAECETIDLKGHLVIPPYVDPHIHLDYVFTAENKTAAAHCLKGSRDGAG